MDIALRRVVPSDIEDIARLANDERIARMTATLPHPYTRENAQSWVDGLSGKPDEYAFAICRGGKMVGVVGLVLSPQHNRAELGYWLGRPHWGQGIATAAAALAIDYAFRELKVRRVNAYCFASNPGSRRVLEKNGLKPEGCLRRHMVRMGDVHDILCFGMLREEYLRKDEQRHENV